MKITIHTPTEQFGYVETEFEGEAGVVDIDAIDTHESTVRVVRGTSGEGMEHKAFLALGDELYNTGKMQADPGIMESMSKTQHDCIRFLSLMQKRND